ncbi:hypothetical protein BJ138DRAFT_1148944 [Hygrophoropsis aurantiaca]|uniref:Uncharacterized protein n=1 Tax=Hygrophoropsis aurantiaca TaxID=72124 RepID=A0ACB8AFG6_9AGAM|nr:hypothetical protein BJ138DRAFT_1148944 [Hygrophoropsis aurantiaca]
MEAVQSIHILLYSILFSASSCFAALSFCLEYQRRRPLAVISMGFLAGFICVEQLSKLKTTALSLQILHSSRQPIHLKFHSTFVLRLSMAVDGQ